MTERVDTAWLRAIAADVEDQVSGYAYDALLAAADELDAMRVAAKEARDTMTHMWSGEPIDDDEVDRVMALLNAANPAPPETTP